MYVRRSANVNLTQLDQNDLPRILLKVDTLFRFKQYTFLIVLSLIRCKRTNRELAVLSFASLCETITVTFLEKNTVPIL